MKLNGKKILVTIFVDDINIKRHSVRFRILQVAGDFSEFLGKYEPNQNFLIFLCHLKWSKMVDFSCYNNAAAILSVTPFTQMKYRWLKMCLHIHSQNFSTETSYVLQENPFTLTRISSLKRFFKNGFFEEFSFSLFVTLLNWNLNRIITIITQLTQLTE